MTVKQINVKKKMYILNKTYSQNVNVCSRKVLGKLLCFFSAHTKEKNNLQLKESLSLYVKSLLPNERKLVNLLLNVYQNNCLNFLTDVLNLQSPLQIREINHFKSNSILEAYDYLSLSQQDVKTPVESIM